MSRRSPALGLVSAFLSVACRAPAPDPVPSSAPAMGPGIVLCGEVFPCDGPVARGFEPPFYDAYAADPRFGGELSAQGAKLLGFGCQTSIAE